jgi:hypothetical protein
LPVAAWAQVSPPAVDSTSHTPAAVDAHAAAPVATLPRGALVRLRLAREFRAGVTGRLLDADPAGVTVAVGGDGSQQAFARDSILRLDVADGTSSGGSRVAKGARIGFGLGAALTAVSLLVSSGQGGDGGVGGLLAVDAELTAATTLLGAVVIGRALSPTRWRPAAVPVRVSDAAGDSVGADSAEARPSSSDDGPRLFHPSFRWRGRGPDPAGRRALPSEQSVATPADGRVLLVRPIDHGNESSTTGSGEAAPTD